MMKIFVGCSSRDNIPSKYYDDCKELLKEVLVNGNELVFGACGKGLMGLSYNIAIDNGSDICGIYPEIYKSETDILNCSLIPVKTVSERTDKIIEQSDVLVFLPGGIGTIYELFTAIESKRGMEHNKPIIIYNSFNFFDDVLCQLKKMSDEKFMSLKDSDYYFVCNNIKEVITYLNNYQNIDKK